MNFVHAAYNAAHPRQRRELAIAAPTDHVVSEIATSPPNSPRSIAIGGITLSFAFLGALARRLGLST
jgi:hypothetical protein